MSKILGIDYGAVRIGIAVSDETGTIAFGREVIDNNSKAVDKIKDLLVTEKIENIVLGYPLNLKGEKTPQTIEVESFEEKLRKYFTGPPFQNITICRWDERFTSKMAADSEFESGMKKKKRQDKSNLDIISAAILLQSYLDSKKNKSETVNPKF
jgi:putative Holliday junction resolvase